MLPSNVMVPLLAVVVASDKLVACIGPSAVSKPSFSTEKALAWFEFGLTVRLPVLLTNTEPLVMAVSEPVLVTTAAFEDPTLPVVLFNVIDGESSAPDL